MKNVVNFILTFIFVFITLTMINGCATIFGWGGEELVNIYSTPEQATVLITDQDSIKIFDGTTPAIASLEKYNGYFSGKKYTITISKEGYSDKVIVIDTKANGWYIGGNLVFGGLIGWFIVDPLTGAMWTFNNNDVDVNLELAKQGSLIKENGLGIMLLQDVPNSLQEKMTLMK
jgi:hypothetical protein